MKRSIVLVLPVAAAAVVATAGSAMRSKARSGALHVTKECSDYHGEVGEFCTITSSNIAVIEPGMRVFYLAAPGQSVLDSDIAVSSGHGGAAVGHVVLDLTTAQGRVTLSGGPAGSATSGPTHASRSIRTGCGTGTAPTASSTTNGPPRREKPC